MRTVYIDSEYKCHVTSDGTMTAVETDFFDGKCGAFIEGYRFVPEGESWTRSDGVVFHGEMVAPFKDSQLLSIIQSLFDEMQTKVKESSDEMSEALEMILTGVTE